MHGKCLVYKVLINNDYGCGDEDDNVASDHDKGGEKRWQCAGGWLPVMLTS